MARTVRTSTRSNRQGAGRSLLPLGSALLWVWACATVPVSGATTAVPTATEEVIFYAASELAAPPLAGILVQDSTLRFVPVQSPASSDIDSAAGPLITALAKANEHRRPVSALALSHHFRVARTDTLQRIFADREQGWGTFFLTFPSDRGFYGTTAPVFSSDSVSALVYVEYHCGTHCGKGELLLVRRDGGRWRTVRRLRHWIS